MRQQQHAGQDPAARRRRDPRARLRRRLRAGGVPRAPEARSRPGSILRSSSSEANASRASIVVSTYAIRSSPFSFEATIWVVITRKPPPKM